MDLSTCTSQSKSCKPRVICCSPSTGVGSTAWRSQDGAWLGALLALGTAISAISLLQSWAALVAAPFAAVFHGLTVTIGTPEVSYTQLHSLLQAQGGPSVWCHLLARASQCREPSLCSLGSQPFEDFQADPT